MNILPGDKARVNTARWIFVGYIILTSLGAILHAINRTIHKEPIDALYIVLMLAIGAAAVYALKKLPLSLSHAMLTFSWTTLVCLAGLLWYILRIQSNHLPIRFMFHVGIFSLGLVLGFRPALQYAIATSFIVLLLGLLYRLPPADIVLPVFFAFAIALPSKVVELVIAQSTAELTHINQQLEELVIERTAALRAEIIERQQAQDALYQRTIELEKRNEELDAYAHTVAHDLKSPLASIIGFSDLLEKRYDKIPADKFGYYCSIIVQNGNKIASIVDALLLLASVRQLEDVPKETLNLSDIMEDIQRRLANAILENKAEIITPDCWPSVISYPPWVEEILVNYVSNAIKYGGTPPRVEIGATRLADGYVRFWVRDNGKGLTPEEQARLFTPFTRLEQVNVKGHGLGLSIVRRIAEKLNVQVGVESEVGHGSTFYFTLPLAKNKT